MVINSLAKSTGLYFSVCICSHLVYITHINITHKTGLHNTAQETTSLHIRLHVSDTIFTTNIQTDMNYCISLVIRQSFFSFLNNPKNQDPSYKINLYFWDSLVLR